MTAATRGAPITRAAVDLVRHFEGQYLKAYLCPAGVPTIGYGHTKGVVMGDVISAAQADALLAEDLDDAAADVDRQVRVRLTPEQRGSLAGFVFNLGAGALASSTLLCKLNQGDYEGATGEFGKWVMATVDGRKVVLEGLVKRRAAEAALFRGEDWRATLDGNDQHHPQPQMLAAPEGDDDDRVCRVQRIIGVQADGVYGPATKEAVRRWQAAHGLVADGVVGPKTAAKMGIG